MATENAKQRDIRQQIERLVQEHVNASDEWSGKGIVVLEVAVAAFGRTPDSKSGGWYGMICEPFTPPHSTMGLFSIGAEMATEEDEDD